jgi:threonine dehydrogenase-like Zn-dependent dehydrogenase
MIIDPTDIVVRIDTSTICGSELYILKGDVPETTPGTVLGHEAVGTVQEIGPSVSTVAVGVPQTFELATELISPGGHVANIGVHGKPATLHLSRS